MIGFQNTGKKKADGKPFWLLVNGDMSAHIHVAPQAQGMKTGLRRISNLEQEDKPPARPSMTEEITESKSDKVATALIEIANSLKLVALSNIAATEEERNSLKARLWNE